MEAKFVSSFNMGNVNFVKILKYNENNVTHVKTLYKLWLP
jgi:hypothetical protein